MRRLHLLTALIMMAVHANTAAAQDCSGSHCDILPARLMITGEDCGTSTFDPSQTVEYSQLVTGARDFGIFPIATLYPWYVFFQLLDGTYSQDDPGFSAVASPCTLQPALSPLPPNTDMYFDFLTEPPTAGGSARNLLYWDAVDDDMNGLDENDVDWSPVPIDEFMRIDELGATAEADGGTNEIEGIHIQQTSGTGTIHDHVDWELRRAGGGLPTAGVYLFKGDLTLPGFAEGAPFYVIQATVNAPVNAGLYARDHVDDNLIFPLCDDGIDNDRDGFIDFAGGDPGCDSALDDSEKSTTYECDDGIDNDGDGFIDYRSDPFGAADLYSLRDPECDSQGATGVSELPEPSLVSTLLVGAFTVAVFRRRRERASAPHA